MRFYRGHLGPGGPGEENDAVCHGHLGPGEENDAVSLGGMWESGHGGQAAEQCHIVEAGVGGGQAVGGRRESSPGGQCGCCVLVLSSRGSSSSAGEGRSGGKGGGKGLRSGQLGWMGSGGELSWLVCRMLREVFLRGNFEGLKYGLFC